MLRTDHSVLINVLDDWKGGVFESHAIHVHLTQARQVPDVPVFEFPGLPHGTAEPRVIRMRDMPLMRIEPG